MSPPPQPPTANPERFNHRPDYRHAVVRYCVIAFLFSVFASTVALERSLAQEAPTTRSSIESDDATTEQPTQARTETPDTDQIGHDLQSDENPTPEESKLQEQFLSEKLAIVQEYHDTLTDTVYWALATVVFMAIAVLGFVWFAFNRSFDREKDSLQAELMGDLESNFSKLKTEIAAERQSLNQDMQQQMSSFQEKTSGKFESLEQDLSALEKRLDRIGKDASDAATKLLLPQINDIRVDVAELAMKRWVDQEVWPNVILSANTLIGSLRDAGKSEFYYRALLNDVRSAVRRIDKIKPHTTEYLDGILRLVPESLSNRRDEIALMAEPKKEKQASE